MALDSAAGMERTLGLLNGNSVGTGEGTGHDCTYSMVSVHHGRSRIEVRCRGTIEVARRAGIFLWQMVRALLGMREYQYP